MDTFIHASTGTLIGWALPQRLRGPGAVPLVVAGALLPDADVLIGAFLDPQSGFAHRGFTHSLLGVAVLAPLAAVVALRLGREKRYARLVALIAMGMISHLLLDLPTPLGVVLFYPLSRNYVHLDFLGYVDWTLFMLALFGLLAAWTYAKRPAAVRRGILAVALLSALSWWLFAEWPTLASGFAATAEEATEVPLRTVYPLVLGGVLLALLVAFARRGWGFRQNRAVFGRIGVAALSIYLAVCVTAQGIALNLTREFTAERGIVAWRRAASRMGYSSLVGPLRWTGLILAPEGVYRASITPFDAEGTTFTLVPSSPDNTFVVHSRSIPEVRGFLAGGRFPVTRYREENRQHVIEHQEYGLSWTPLLRVVLNERREVLEVGRVDH